MVEHKKNVLPAKPEMEDLRWLGCGWSGTELKQTLHLKNLRNKNMTHSFSYFESYEQKRVFLAKHTFDIFIHVFDDAGKRRHVLLCKRDADVVANEVVPGLQHWGGDEVQNAGGQTEELQEQLWLRAAPQDVVKN